MKVWAKGHPITLEFFDSRTATTVAGIVVIELKFAGVRNTTRVHPSNVVQPVVLFCAPNHVARTRSTRIRETTTLIEEPAAKASARFGVVSLHHCTS